MDKKKIFSLLVFLVYFLVFLIIVYFRWNYSSSIARTWDEVDFALALNRFDLLAMQPHFPGYPYFILGGMILSHFIHNPVEALSKLNVLMSSLAIIPMFLLFRYYLSVHISFVVSVLVQTITYMWILATVPISEGVAIAILWWFLWSLKLAIEKNSLFYILLPAVLFGFLMGTRLSFLPFGIGLLLLAIYDWKLEQNNRLFRQIVLWFTATLSQLLWVMGLVLSEGSLKGFIELSLSFVDGHFNDWGGTVSSSSMPFLERVYTLITHNLLWVGIFGQSVFITTIIIVSAIAVIIKVIGKKNIKLDLFHCWLYILIIFYFLWALFAQNIEKPRHISPLIGLIVYVYAFYLFKYLKQSMALLIISILVMIQTVHGISIVKEQAKEVPAVYQLIEALENMDDEKFIIYTWEETRVMEYANVPFEHKRIFTYNYFLDEINTQENKNIYVTNRVLEGFKQQGANIEDKVQKIQTFSSNPLFDPVYSEITLYKWE